MNRTAPFKRLTELLSREKKSIYAIYMFAIFSGLIQLSLPLGVQSIIGFVLGAAFSTSLAILIGLVILGVFLSGLLQIQQMRIIETLQQKIYHRYAFLFKQKMIDIDLKQSDDLYYPEAMNRFLDVGSLQKGLSKILLDIPLASIQILLGLMIVAIYHPLFLIMVFLMLIIVVIIFYLTSKKGLETSIKESSYKYATTGWLEEIARLVHIFKIHRQHKFSLKKMDHKVDAYLDYRTRHFRILLFQFKNLVFLKIMITAAMLIVGTYLLINQQLNIGQFVAAEIIIITMIASVEKIIINLDTFYDILTSLDKLHSIEQQPAEPSGGSTSPAPGTGMHVEFSQVSFSYLPEQTVLHHLDFRIQPGEKIGITGRDGSGKSTLLRLISTLYTPNAGTILYNGIPNGQYNLTELRSGIGLMYNRLDLFNGTLLDNIAVGNPDLSVARVIAAARQIGLDPFLNNSPGGLDTPVDTTGKKLPRTVIKKIMLLRATAGLPPLILLEEPLSELDAGSRSLVMEYLFTQLNGCTLILVTNDEDCLERCDRRFTLANGQLTINPKTS